MISSSPHNTAADLCAFIAGTSITISFVTVVEIAQLIAGLIAIVTGALSLYFHWKRWRAQAKPKRRRRVRR